MHSLAVLVAASMLRFLDPYTSLYQTDDDREAIAYAYREAKQRTLWERITRSNHKDVTFYKGLLLEYTRDLLLVMREDFLEEVKGRDIEGKPC